MEFKGRTAIVTGAGGGLGKAYAKALCSGGANVVIAEFDDEKGTATATEFNDKGWSAAFVHTDVSNEDDVRKAVQKTVDLFGGVDILINNAQATSPGNKNIEETSTDLVHLCWNTGFYGAFLFTKYCLPHMREKGYGRILNVASASGAIGQEGFSAYGSQKEAIRGLTRITAQEYGRYGITCNSICPGALTEPARKWKEENPEAYAAVVTPLAMRRLGDPDTDIAPVVAFLVSDDARYLTGQTIGLDGGMTRY